ncbi:MAG: hypothetical protein ABW019_18470 [Chitinophagaceae bacterium]
MNYQLPAIIILSQFLSCASTGQLHSPGAQGRVFLTTHFYDAQGNPTYTDVLKIWYRDSSVVQEINNIATTTAAGITRTEYILMLYRYIDLRNKVLYDYKSFSDTSAITHKAILPDSMMQDYGWSFYSDKILRIKGVPEPLSDTVISNIEYKRLKFSFEWQDPKKNFLIGYLRCDGKGNQFSLEKSYSRQMNCTMVKFFDFMVGMRKPYGSQEVDFISDTLTAEESKVFDAWERNARQNPVK